MRTTPKKILAALLLSASLAACGTDGEGGTAGDDGGDDGGTDTAGPVIGSCDAPIAVTEADLIEDLVWQVTGTTTGAPREQTGSCVDEFGPERAYEFVAPEAGVYRVLLEGPDPLLHVRRSSCSAAAFEVACNDDREDEGRDSEVVFEAGEGDTFFLFADSFEEEEAGPFTMTVELDADAVVYELPDGMWASRGYGLGLVVEAGLVILIEYSDAHCMSTMALPLSGLSEIISDLELGEETLTLYALGAVAPYVFDAISAPPEACLDEFTSQVGDDDYQRNPLFDLEVLLQTFEEQYAFFALREIDWTALGDAARAMVTEDSTDEELFDAMVTVLAPLNDGHVSLQSDDDEFESKPLRFFADIFQEFAAAGSDGDPEDYLEAQIGAWYAALDALFEDGLQGGDGEVVWGRFDDETGYLNILHFNFGDEGMQNINDAIEALADTDTLVIDIRVNVGGSDTIALDVAGRFFNERTLAFTKQARNGDGLGDIFGAYVEPFDGTRYDGDIVLIVSESTVSAAEIFTMTMAQRDDVLIVGQATSGEFSDILERALPNGWSFGLSNEVYRDADGNNYEATGIPVDLELTGSPVPLEDREGGTDGWLQTLSEL
jgi:carboxyl-terminal processing protease